MLAIWAATNISATQLPGPGTVVTGMRLARRDDVDAPTQCRYLLYACAVQAFTWGCLSYTSVSSYSVHILYCKLNVHALKFAT